MRRGFLAGACLLLLAAACPAESASAESLVAAIRKVGKEGTGNAHARRAWKELVALGPPALPAILAGMRDREEVANNWLRPAFEAIAEKATAQGKLEASPLEKAVVDRGQSGAARALAYAWVARLDKKAAERLLPGMLTDPSPDLRRIAVDHLVTEAGRLAKAGDKKKAVALYRQAFRAAGTPEQVSAIAMALTGLGEKVDPAKRLGVVSRWHLIAPFDNTKDVGFSTAYPPEKGIDLTATYPGKGGKQAVWIDHATPNKEGLVDLKKVLGPLKGTVAYAFAGIDLPAARTVELRAGSINSLKIFVNGKEVFANQECHHGSRIDQYAVRLRLNKGRNEILLKVCQNEQNEPWAQSWQFQLRLCDEAGCGITFSQDGLK